MDKINDVVTKIESKIDDKDLFRDTPIRYLGYSNEIGEAFRNILKKVFVNSTYVVAVGYVCADTYDKSVKVYKRPFQGGPKNAMITAGDVLIWQMFASVIIPGFTINRICYVTGRLLSKFKAHRTIRKIGPTGVGLLSIPLIIHPIDRAMDYVMDNSYRKYIKCL